MLSLPKQLHHASIIIAQHSGHEQKDMLIDILRRVSTIKIVIASNGALLEARRIYVCPPDFDILLEGDRIVLQAPANMKYSKPSVDLLFNSLTNIKDAVIFGIVLSGAGKDGAAGLKAIHIAGGKTLIQNPATAKFNSMPTAALSTFG